MTLEEILSRLLTVYVSETKKLVHATISNNTDSETDETINTTDNHPFYVEGKGWIATIELEEGDILRTADGEVKTVKDVTIEYLDEPELIYNLEIEGYHTYFVSDDNVLVHNKCGTGTGEGGSDVNNPLENIEYTDKVLKQMQQGDYHAFPDSVTAFGDMANAEQIIGGDGVARMKYEIGGIYDGKNGVFQFIIEPDGYTCNHRLFVPSQ